MFCETITWTKKQVTIILINTEAQLCFATLQTSWLLRTEPPPTTG